MLCGFISVGLLVVVVVVEEEEEEEEGETTSSLEGLIDLQIPASFAAKKSGPTYLSDESLGEMKGWKGLRP